MLRTPGRYSSEAMIQQYQTHIWGYSEYTNGSICHAVHCKLERLHSMQRRFLHGIDLDEATAHLQYNFAPPTLRRDIGIPGLIHKRNLGFAHPAFNTLLPLVPASWYAYPPTPSHNNQITNSRSEVIYQHDMFSRSIFGYVDVYNRLPQYIIECDTVRSFQKELSIIARHRCRAGIELWNCLSMPSIVDHRSFETIAKAWSCWCFETS